MNKIKYCKFCDKEKPEEDFCKSGGYIKNICRDCQNKKQKQIYQDSKRTKQLEQEIEELNNRIEKAKHFIDQVLGYHLSSGYEQLDKDCNELFGILKGEDKE